MMVTECLYPFRKLEKYMKKMDKFERIDKFIDELSRLLHTQMTCLKMFIKTLDEDLDMVLSIIDTQPP